MKQKFILFILLISCFKTYAQSNYETGFIITQDADTIKGYIHTGKNNSYQKLCLFRTSLNEGIQKIQASQLASFQFNNGEKYISINHLNKKNENEQIFALVLEEGRLNLYFYRGTYYVQKQKGRITRLKNNEIKVIVDGVESRKKSQKYIGILSYLLSDYPQLRSQVQKINYSGKDISRLINKYNTKFNSTKSKTKIPWSITEFGGYLSTSYSRPEFSIEEEELFADHLSNANWKFSQQIGCGLFIENRHSRISKNWAIHLETHFQKITYSSSAEIMYSSTKYIYDNQVEHYTLNIPVGVKYYQAYQSVKAYIMGGLYFKKTFAHNNKTSGLRQTSDNIFILPEMNTYEPESNKLGLWFSLGLRKKINKKLDLFSEIRYSKNKSKVSTTINNTHFVANQKNINIGLHIGLYF